MLEGLKQQAIEGVMKQLAPGVVNNIFNSFEALIDETGSKNDLSPYLLHVKIEREDQNVLAVVYWGDINLETISLIGMIEETFNQSLAKVPKMFQPMATKMMQGMSVTEIVLKNLEDYFIILRFDEEDELVSYKVQDEEETLLDWMEFIANAKIDL
jgi:hypothetical protein